MVKKVIYKEPSSYFNADMRKAAEEWERQHKKEEKEAKKEASKKKK